jgi:hypothetical protein
MLATPVIGFVVGAGGYLAAQVFADTYSGKMPGPKSFGYFIGTITAATALGLAFMGRKQGYLAESSYLKLLIDDQEKPPKQDLSKVDLSGYVFKGRPIKRAEEYVAQLSIPEQKIIEHRLRKALENDYSGAELEDIIERGLDSRVSDLSDTIDISDFAAESGRCANCNAAAKITAYDLPVGPRNFCSERCYCMYSGLPVMEPGYYGMEAEQKLSKTECCCGATIDNPCECMLTPEPMQCSAKEPKCPCYAAKSAETFETTFLGNIPDWELHAMYNQGKITLGQLRLGIGWKKLHEDRKRIRTMSGRPVSETLRKMKRDQNITPEEARERKEIRAESCGCTTCKCRN